MRHAAIIATIIAAASFQMAGQERFTIVADSATRAPLPGASIFDSNGKMIGLSSSKGRLPRIDEANYPITIRYIGFEETRVAKACSDTIFLKENIAELPEVVAETKSHKVLHVLGYVREYSMLTTYTDTVFLFREKMVDYMLKDNPHVKFRGWTRPRVLSSKSYYRFTNSAGLDSVSDRSNNHFSWSDWMGIAPETEMPFALQTTDVASDTLRGKYSAAESWAKNNDRVTIDVNILADTASRHWIPDMAGFFRKRDMEFDNFRLRLNYGNVAGNSVKPIDLTGYSFNIASNGRGYQMFKFNRVGDPYFVDTYGEVYIVDKEYITVKEAKKWERKKIDSESIGLLVPTEAPELQPDILRLVYRVNNIDTDKIRVETQPDMLMMRKYAPKRQDLFGRAFNILKTITGISKIRSNRKNEKNWRDFKRSQILKNSDKDFPEE